jgi:hypothetical protein
MNKKQGRKQPDLIELEEHLSAVSIGDHAELKKFLSIIFLDEYHSFIEKFNKDNLISDDMLKTNLSPEVVDYDPASISHLLESDAKISLESNIDIIKVINSQSHSCLICKAVKKGKHFISCSKCAYFKVHKVCNVNKNKNYWLCPCCHSEDSDSHSEDSENHSD